MPPLKVFDPLWSNYINPASYPLAEAQGKLGVTHGADNWGLVPTVPPFTFNDGTNGRRICAYGRLLAGETYPTPGKNWYANVWKKDVFSPDHYAEVSHNPQVYTSSALRPVYDAGVSVRQDPNSDSCYVLTLIYHDNGNGHPDITISKIKDGVKTVLANAHIPTQAHLQDWWYMQLQVWGQNPVKLRVVTKAPTIFVTGGTDQGFLPGRVTYDHPDFGGPVEFVQVETDEFGNTIGPSEFCVAHPTWAEYGIPPDNELGIPALGVISQPGQKIWTVWEGEDASSDRLLIGQPGLRGLPALISYGTGHGVADFTAGDLYDRFTIRQISDDPVTIGGYKATGTTVSIIELPTADIIQTLEGTEWQLVTGYLGVTLTATDGTDILEIIVTGLEVTADPPQGTYPSNKLVTLTCNDPTALIYYTLDGSDPKDVLTIDETTNTCVMDNGIPITDGVTE